MDNDTFFRDIEAHLCRRNGGHLVRLVGPSFEIVVGWARQGIPLKVACRGIDRFFERDHARERTRRRPVRIEFCEADVLDAFDEWRRALGVGTAGAGGHADPGGETGDVDREREPEPTASGGQRPGQSLRAHLDRVALRLTDRLTGGQLPPDLEAAVARAIEHLAPYRDASRTLRGEARLELVSLLQRLDESLLEAARSAADPGMLVQASRDAEGELEAFRARMSEDAFTRARDAAIGVLLRERLKLPVIAYNKA